MMDGGKTMNIPNHVAIILDGNGRWAKAKGMPRKYGHVQGAKTLEDICEVAYRMGIQYLTVYAFSTENWNRPQDEVDALMKLFRNYMKNCLKIAEKNNMCVRVIGEKSRLADDLIQSVTELEEATKNNTGLHFTVAINYGGRDELAYAARILAQKAVNGEIKPEDINEQSIADELYTKGIPDVDLVIRPSGEMRLSNYLIWQCAYAEYYFTDILWPDFTPAELDKALIEFGRRNRRFGGV